MPVEDAVSLKPDWILNTIDGKTTDINKIYGDGLKLSDFSLREKDEYWGLDDIKSFFKTPEGEEDYNAFSRAYDTEKDRYTKMLKAEFDVTNFNDQYANASSERYNVKVPSPKMMKTSPDMWGRTYGFDFSDGTGYSAKQYGWREKAINTGVKLSDGSYVNPKEFEGLAKFATNPNGTIKIDDSGSPYLEPVKDGEELMAHEQVYNPMTEWMGYYGHDYEWKHIATSIPKNFVGFLASTMDSLAEFPKAILGWNEEGKQSDAYRNIVDFENWTKQFNPSMTERGMEGFFTLESLTDLAQQVIWQIGGMVATGGSVSTLTKVLGAAGQSAKAGSIAGRLFMTGIAAGPIAEVARDNGLSGKETALLLGATSAALYPLMAIEEFVAGRKVLGMSNAGIQDAVNKFAKTTIQKGFNPSSIRTGMSTLYSDVKSALYKANKLPDILKGAGGESLEETAEQLVDIGVRSLYNVYNDNIDVDSPVAQALGTNKSNKFQFDWVQEAKNLGYAATGGAIGGAVAAPLMKKLRGSHPELAYDLEEMIVDGKENTIYKYIDSMEQRGKLDHPWTDAEGNYTEEQSKSANAEAANILRGTVKYLTELRDSQSLQHLYRNNTGKIGNSTIFRAALQGSNIGKDAATLFSEINKLNGEIKEIQEAEGGLNEEDLDEKTKLRDQKQDALNNIKRGKFVADYVAEGLYNVNAIGRSDPEYSISNLSGKNFVNLSKNSPTFVTTANENIKEQNEELEEANRSATIDNYEKLTADGKERLINEAREGFLGAYNNLKPHADSINNVIAESGLDFGVEFAEGSEDMDVFAIEPLLENETIDESLKPLISDVLLANERLKKIKDFEPVEATPEMKESHLMLHMVNFKDDGKIATNSNIPIEKKIADELKLKEESTKDGVSFYSNIKPVEEIVNSIKARIAQAKANPIVGDQVKNLYKAQELTPFEVLKEEDQKEILDKLYKFLGTANALLEESKQNMSSQEVLIRKSTIAKLKEHYDKIISAQQHFASTDYNQISDIIGKYSESLDNAVAKGEIQNYLIFRKKMEDEIFKYSKDKRDSVLGSLEFGTASSGEIMSGKYNELINLYEYMRGVTAVSATRVWNAYNQTIKNSSNSALMPSDNQLLQAVDAFYGLAGGQYNTFQNESFAMTSHHNSYFIDDIGGSGKTSVMAPIVAGMYQKIFGGNILLTAYKSNNRKNKISNLAAAFKNYFEIGKNVYGASAKTSTDKNIRDFIKSEQANDTNLIVYDEVTLLPTQSLDAIQKELDKVNALRAMSEDPNVRPLSILYLGDSNQNSPSQGNADLEHLQGINDIARHQIARGKPSNFSFRDENQQLKILNKYSKDIQKESGKLKPMVTEYGRDKNGEKGARIVYSDTDFNKIAETIALRLKNDGKINDAVYITDKSAANIPAWVSATGITVLTSEESQGEEWDYVFYDPSNKKIYGKKTYIVPKKQFHTATTRAKKFFLANIDQDNNLSSKEGKIYNITPITPSKTTREFQLERNDKILGDSKMETEDGKYLFKQESSKSTAPSSPTPPKSDSGRSPKVVQGEDKLSEYLRTRNQKDTIHLHTFFTVEGQNEIKNKAIYDPIMKGSGENYSYNLTIAKIGTPEYTNVVNNNPRFNGTYAIIIEGNVDGENAVLGVLSPSDAGDAFQRAKDLEDFISSSKIMEGRDKITVPLERNFLFDSSNFQPTVKFDNNNSRTLGELQAQYEGIIQFGTPRIAVNDLKSTNPDRELTAEKGEIILPITVAYNTKSDIDAALFDDPRESPNTYQRYITLVGINKAQLDLDTLYQELEKYVDENGKFNVSDAGLVYETFFAHDAHDIVDPDTKIVEDVGRLTQTINRIYDSIDDDPAYKSFVSKYTRKAEIGQTAGEELTLEQIDQRMAEIGQIKSRNHTAYLLANYIEARKANHTKNLALFNRLFKDIQRDPRYLNGFYFNPRVGEQTGANNIHRPAYKGMEDLYKKYLMTDVVEISPPSISISKQKLLNAMGSITSPSIDPITPEIINSDGPVVDEEQLNKNPESESSPIYTLVDYQESNFKGELASLVDESINRFKRTLYNKIFDTKNKRMRPIAEAMDQLEATLESNAIPYFKEDMNEFDPVNNAAHRSMYIDYVINKEQDFLIKKYFPIIVKSEITNEYAIKSSHTKSRSFNDKESYSLFKEGMTEMIKTQLETTPILRKTSNGTYVTTGKYLSLKSDVEEIIDIVKQAKFNDQYNDIESIKNALKASPSDVAQSMYVKFFSDEVSTVNGEEINSLSTFDNVEVSKIVDALGVFFSTGEIFNLAHVDLTSKENKIPLNEFWSKPNIIREEGQQGMRNKAYDVHKGNVVMKTSPNSVTFDRLIFTKKENYSDDEVLSALNTIGFEFISQEHLEDMLENEVSEMQLRGDIDQRVNDRNKFLMDEIVFPAFNNIANNTVSYIAASNSIYRSVARVDGLNTSIDTLNINGDRVYRLRNTSPVFSVQKRLNETISDPRFEKNMLRDHYEVTSFFLKDGFKNMYRGRKISKSNNSLSWEESLEYDLIWNFANSLSKTKRAPAFGLSPMVYSDGSSDITPIVRVRELKESIFSKHGINKVIENLFASRVAYYSGMEQRLLHNWNTLLGTDFKTVGSLNSHLRSMKKPVDPRGVQGMVKNIDYVAQDGKYVIKPTLVSDIQLYKIGNFNQFSTIMDQNYKKFESKVNDLDGKYDIKKKIVEQIDTHPVDNIMKAFYYNWVAVSSEMTNLLMGDSSQFKGTNKTDEYIDFTKRAKAMMSNHSTQIFRNRSWEDQLQIRKDVGQELDDKFIYEGMKLTRNYKVAYVNDPEVGLMSFAGESHKQEIYDGATFVTPLTRIFQKASNGADYGTNVSHVMKNITTSPVDGVTTFIKNAEFELTPEIMKNGTPRVQHMVKQMLDQKFSEPVQIGEDNVKSAWDILTNILGVKEDLSNVEYEHFEELARQLVVNGVQDSPILEIVPNTSVKTGGGATTSIDGIYHPEIIDIYDKGTQLDASKDPTKGLQTTATSQLFNSLGLNWLEPEATMRVHSGLAAIADVVRNNYQSLSPEELTSEIKKIIKTAQEGNEGITYQHKLLNTDYSFDDRQILNRAISVINAEFTKQGVAINFDGGQYVVHPANGLVNVYDNSDGSVVLKSRAENKENGRDLAYIPPSIKISTDEGIKVLEEERKKALSKVQDKQSVKGKIISIFKGKVKEEGQAEGTEETIESVNASYDERLAILKASSVDGQNTIYLTDTPQFRRLVRVKKSGNPVEIRDAYIRLQRAMQDEKWEAGYAEILLPAEMQRDFFLEEGTDLQDITPEYFANIIEQRRNKTGKKPYAQSTINNRANEMYEAFQKRLRGLMIRIPTTGKHSAMGIKVVAFMEGSDNSVFVPAELLMIQGADQDIDKGSYLTYGAVDGFLPEVDENFDLLSKYSAEKTGLISKGKRASARLIGIKNDIIDNIRTIIETPKNAVEANISVDIAMKELRDLRDEYLENVSFDRDDYISHVQMHEINQSGKALVGIFANALKAYQVMYDTYRTIGKVDNNILSGLESEFNEEWINFAGLINAATDNAKEQILGTLGIGTHNANIVSYMIATGSSFREVVDFLKTNETYMNDLKENSRFDSTSRFFDAQKEWGKKNPELANLYDKAQEFSLLARSLSINRDLPNSAYEMYNYKRNIEDFINKAFKDNNMKGSKLDLITFIENDNYADAMVANYQKVINSSENHQINVLEVLRNSNHIRAYSKLFGLAYKTVESISNITRISNEIANNSEFITDDAYGGIVDFTYGLAISEYMQQNKIKGSFNRFDLGTINGRNEFVHYMGDSQNGFLPYLKQKYENNAFVQRGLFIESSEKYQYDDAPQLRTHELMHMDEQRLIQLQAGFNSLEESDRSDLINYGLITRKGAMGRGSISQLVDPKDTVQFNEFLKGFDINVNNSIVNKYKTFDQNTNNTGNYHNSIPYSITEEAPKKAKKSDNTPRISDSDRYKVNAILRKLNAQRKGASQFRSIPTNTSLTDSIYFFGDKDPVNILELIKMALQSQNIKPKDKETLTRMLNSMQKQVKTYYDAKERQIKCKGL